MIIYECSGSVKKEKKADSEEDDEKDEVKKDTSRKRSASLDDLEERLGWRER
ncbi:hypothetical protein F2Q69_00011553 [Brassica cretica]|uniref:Uncharacterized protein n=1 Tax=Brassica cretica TaxID=69181 RepID=A0A8S9R9J7_BRACR|nr:hypothetical protein F2Q69_00011553 [Brassica cretica]